jgi:hypothetical protein
MPTGMNSFRWEKRTIHFLPIESWSDLPGLNGISTHHKPNHRARRLEPKCSLSARKAIDGS